jgi:hypothetical protein
MDTGQGKREMLDLTDVLFFLNHCIYSLVQEMEKGGHSLAFYKRQDRIHSPANIMLLKVFSH